VEEQQCTECGCDNGEERKKERKKEKKKNIH
jgi:hypothetical protein